MLVSILSRSTLQGASFASVRILNEAFVASWNQKAALFRVDESRNPPAANETLLL
jgi:hypothetical protein